MNVKLIDVNNHGFVNKAFRHRLMLRRTVTDSPRLRLSVPLYASASASHYPNPPFGAQELNSNPEKKEKTSILPKSRCALTTTEPCYARD